MDTMPANDPMEKPRNNPLAGLDPADLLKQGVAEDTLMEETSPPFTPPPLEEIATIFPQFEILELIGQGGMGAVYKVRQKDLDRIVALKILPPAIGRSPEFSNRFTREAKALAKLNHPGIVTLHEFGQQDGLYFILMEFVDGVNLAQLMKTGRVSPREALAIVPQICDALQFAHDQGIVHRDIKPENILLDRLGRVKVADFGIAKVVVSAGESADDSGNPPPQADATIAGKVMGTPAYMAPEQIEHPSEVDHRADIYALGIVFYQMLTGELPGKELEPPSRKVSIDVRLDEVVLRALEEKPELRYQQASVLKTRVETIAGNGAEQGVKASHIRMVRLVEAVFETRFTSPLAIKFINLSALGFLGCLGFLGYVALPGTRPLFVLWGLFGLFGLLGFAFPIEKAHRRRQAGLHPDARSAQINEQPSRFFRMAIAAVLLSAVTVLFLTLDRGPQWFKHHFGNTSAMGKPSSATSVTTNSAFGPVIERVVNDDRPGATNFLIDLDTGRLVTPPSPKEAGWNWTVANGIDAIGCTDANVRGLLSTGGTVVVPVVADAWETFSVYDVRQIVVPLSSTLQGGTAMPGKDRLPVTYAFKTREDCMGVLQITGFTENPPGVKIHYKLVQNSESSPQSAAPTTVSGPQTGRTFETTKDTRDGVPGDSFKDTDRILVEDLALHMIVAIREKDDAKLKALASDRIKGWRDALPQFAVELREHYRQSTGNEGFDLRASESLVDGDLAVVRCTGPAELKGKCLVLYFVKSDDGWRSYSLRATTEGVPLPELMQGLKTQIQQVRDSAVPNKGAPKVPAPETLEETAAKLAEAWLAGIDAGNYAQSWKDAAKFFRTSITEAAWSDALTKARKPLGEVKSRKLLNVQSAKSLPGAPDGEYVVMQFDTSFAAKEKAVETVTFMKDSAGTWKAAGYFIR